MKEGLVLKKKYQLSQKDIFELRAILAEKALIEVQAKEKLAQKENDKLKLYYKWKERYRISLKHEWVVNYEDNMLELYWVPPKKTLEDEVLEKRLLGEQENRECPPEPFGIVQ